MWARGKLVSDMLHGDPLLPLSWNEPYHTTSDANDSNWPFSALCHIEQVVEQRLFRVLCKEIELIQDKDDRVLIFGARF